MGSRARLVGASVLVAAAAGALALPTTPASGGTARDGTFARRQVTGERPSERSTPAVAAIGESIYVFGGVKDDFRTNVNTFYDDLHRFDTRTDTWTKLAPAGPLPPARAFAASAADEVSRRTFVFGGATYGPLFVGFVAHDDLWAYSVDANSWTRLVGSTPGPSGRSRPNMWLVEGRLYVFGGITATFQTLDDLWAYDIAANAWTEIIPNGAAGSPPSRHEAQAGTVAVGGALTLYGGEAVDLLGGVFFEMLPDTWEFDLAEGAWRDVTPDPAHDVQPPRNYGAAAVVGNALYLYGGDVPGGSSGCGAPFPQNPTGELWRLDLVRHAWRRLAPAGDETVPLKRTNAAIVDRRMYIFAGFDFRCEEPTDPGQVWNLDVWSYEPPGRPR